MFFSLQSGIGKGKERTARKTNPRITKAQQEIEQQEIEQLCENRTKHAIPNCSNETGGKCFVSAAREVCRYLVCKKMVPSNKAFVLNVINTDYQNDAMFGEVATFYTMMTKRLYGPGTPSPQKGGYVDSMLLAILLRAGYVVNYSFTQIVPGRIIVPGHIIVPGQQSYSQRPAQAAAAAPAPKVVVGGSKLQGTNNIYFTNVLKEEDKERRELVAVLVTVITADAFRDFMQKQNNEETNPDVENWSPATKTETMGRIKEKLGSGDLSGIQKHVVVWFPEEKLLYDSNEVPKQIDEGTHTTFDMYKTSVVRGVFGCYVLGWSSGWVWFQQ